MLFRSGLVVITENNLINKTANIICSFADEDLIGFTEGSNIKLKMWNHEKQEMFDLTYQIISGGPTFAKNASTFIQFEDLTTQLDDNPLLESNILCYPNPFNDVINIEINLNYDANLQIEVLNNFGQHVEYIISDINVSKGLNTYVWNTQLSSGIYYLRTKLNDEIYTNKIILINQ